MEPSVAASAASAPVTSCVSASVIMPDCCRLLFRTPPLPLTVDVPIVEACGVCGAYDASPPRDTVLARPPRPPRLPPRAPPDTSPPELKPLTVLGCPGMPSTSVRSIRFHCDGSRWIEGATRCVTVLPLPIPLPLGLPRPLPLAGAGTGCDVGSRPAMLKLLLNL